MDLVCKQHIIGLVDTTSDRLGSHLVTTRGDGLATDGSAVPPGRYEVRAEAIGGGVNEAYDVLIADQVRSVSLPSGGKPLTLELAGLGTVDFSQVRQIS